MAKKKLIIPKQNIVCFILGLIISIVIIVPLFNFTSRRHIVSEGENLDDHWNIVVAGQAYTDVSLSQTVFPVTNRGDEVEIVRTIGNVKQIPNALLKFYTVHSAVQVFVDNDLIYEYGMEYFDTGEMIGYGYHYVDLPADYANKELLIHFYVTENDAFTGIPKITINNSMTFLQESISGDRIRLAGALFLILFGAFGMISSCFVMLYNSKYMPFFCISMFSLLIGVWTLCNNDMIMYFTQNLLVKCYFEYLSLYTLPIPFLFYFFGRVVMPEKRKGENSLTINKRMTGMQFLYWFLLLGQITFLAIVVIGQVTNITHFPVYLKYSHVFMALDIVLVIWLFIDSRKRKVVLGRGLQVGMIIAFFFILFELIRYNISKYIFTFDGNEYSSTLCFGAMIIVFCLLGDYSFQITNSLYKLAEEDLLRTMAYSDKLTGLGNRRKCDDSLNEFEAEKSSFAMISVDLNLLKYYNDAYGHERGDELLVAYAEVLRKSAEPNMILCRNGGDEFCVLIPDEYKWDEKLFFYKHGKALEEANAKLVRKAEGSGEEAIRLSMAIGVARRSEVKYGDFHAVCRLADERMYDNKRKMKEAR